MSTPTCRCPEVRRASPATAAGTRPAAQAGLRANVLLAALVLAGCAAPPPPPPAPTPRSYVALLANEDGSTGKVVYANPQGTVQLDQPLQAAGLSGTPGTFVISEQQLQRDAGAALGARPVAPRVFIVYFEAGNTRLTTASRDLLPQVLVEVRQRAGADLSIIGHADTKGDAAQNVTLSMRRAEQVAQLLKEASASAAATEVSSHGERNLLVATPDETDEPRNRRVEITVR